MSTHSTAKFTTGDIVLESGPMPNIQKVNRIRVGDNGEHQMTLVNPQHDLTEDNELFTTSTDGKFTKSTTWYSMCPFMKYDPLCEYM